MNREKPNRKRKNAHLLYLSDAEEEAIKERMEFAHITSFSKYARRSMIDAYFFVIDDSEQIKKFTYELSKIGNIINQIAHALNSGDNVSKETIEEIKEMMVSIWQYQRYILSGTQY